MFILFDFSENNRNSFRYRRRRMYLHWIVIVFQFSPTYRASSNDEKLWLKNYSTLWDHDQSYFLIFQRDFQSNNLRRLFFHTQTILICTVHDKVYFFKLVQRIHHCNVIFQVQCCLPQATTLGFVVFPGRCDVSILINGKTNVICSTAPAVRYGRILYFLFLLTAV